MIGDPSGKSQERNLLSAERIAENVEGLRSQMKRFLDFGSGTHSAELVNNFDWTGTWSYLEFLRDVGKNFPVNVMLAKDSVKSRLAESESGLSFTEFSYMLLQAYDFVHLHDQEVLVVGVLFGTVTPVEHHVPFHGVGVGVDELKGIFLQCQ